MLVALTAENGWDIDNMYVVTKFLNPLIVTDFRMEIPEGLQATTGKIGKLRNTRYGLKEAPRLWNDHINVFLNTLVAKHSSGDINLYITAGTFILLYVDNLLIAGNSRTEINWIKQDLTEKYEMNDLVPVKQFLSIPISRVKEGSIRSSQQIFVQTNLECFDMENCNDVCNPMEAGIKLRKLIDADCEDPELTACNNK